MSAMRSRATGSGDARDPGPMGRQVRRLPFTSASGAVARSRTFLRTSMRAYGWLPSDGRTSAPAADDILLVAVELVTNACLHGGGPVELRMVREDGTVRIEVDDRSDARPEPRSPFDGPRAGGHGLHIVRRLAREWGVRPHGHGRHGKTVWAELAEPDRAVEDDGRPGSGV
ncbi:ATP-binding protein [Yinghuangia seranimata]|uniref:ATP-binding protein n=1 Tax=Yinghuangia seranimata TaxID=408067 RepID=UPI00248B0567|nr:ATP-binding protein [Yinghuangia seranimata]MDI2128960.1 ATP-binding protein [Yinghuangia seranimata]